MSDAEIDAAIRDAEQYAAQDQMRREALDIGREAQQLISDAEKALDQQGKQLDKAEKKQIKDDISTLRKLVYKNQPDKMQPGDIAAIRDAMEKLKQSSSKWTQL